MALITFLYIFSLERVIKWTGHEFFRKTHYIVASICIGTCWAHWSRLVCWMITSLGIFGLDRGIRLLRTLLIHIGYLDGLKNKLNPSEDNQKLIHLSRFLVPPCPINYRVFRR